MMLLLCLFIGSACAFSSALLGLEKNSGLNTNHFTFAFLQLETGSITLKCTGKLDKAIEKAENLPLVGPGYPNNDDGSMITLSMGEQFGQYRLRSCTFKAGHPAFVESFKFHYTKHGFNEWLSPLNIAFVQPSIVYWYGGPNLVTSAGFDVMYDPNDPLKFDTVGGTANVSISPATASSFVAPALSGLDVQYTLNDYKNGRQIELGLGQFAIRDYYKNEISKNSTYWKGSFDYTSDSAWTAYYSNNRLTLYVWLTIEQCSTFYTLNLWSGSWSNVTATGQPHCFTDRFGKPYESVQSLGYDDDKGIFYNLAIDQTDQDDMKAFVWHVDFTTGRLLKKIPVTFPPPFNLSFYDNVNVHPYFLVP